MNIKYFYYINLEKRKDRKRHIESQIQKSHILSNRLTRYNAVDGYNLDIESIDSNIVTEHGKKDIIQRKVKQFGVTLSYGSIACAMSHYNLFQICANNNDGNILIFEDDIILPTNIDRYIDIINERNDYDIFYLGIHHNSHTSKINIVDSDIYHLNGIFWGCFAYVLTPKACEFIINNVFPISVQFDSIIGNKIRQHKLKALCFSNNIVKCGQFGSDNQGKNGLNNKSILFHAWDQVFN